MASAYCSGEGGIPKDVNRAFELNSQAAAQGNLDAMVQLANAYTYGRGVDEDLAKAETLLKKAADHCHVGAAASLGSLYEEKLQNYPEAFVWHTLAADRGHTASQLIGLSNVREKLSEAQIAEAGKRVAAIRAEHPNWRLRTFDTWGSPGEGVEPSEDDQKDLRNTLQKLFGSKKD